MDEVRRRQIVSGSRIPSSERCKVEVCSCYVEATGFLVFRNWCSPVERGCGTVCWRQKLVTHRQEVCEILASLMTYHGVFSSSSLMTMLRIGTGGRHPCTVMNLRVPWNTGNFLTSWGPVRFSRNLLHGVSKQAACYYHFCSWFWIWYAFPGTSYEGQRPFCANLPVCFYEESNKMHFFVCVYFETLHASNGYTVHHSEFTLHCVCSCIFCMICATAAYTVTRELLMMNGVSLRNM